MLLIVAGIVLLFGFVVFVGAPYVPSKRREVEAAFSRLRPLDKNDLLVDLGSGDGLVLRAAARRGARAVGYELNPALVWISRWVSRRYPRIEVRTANMWRVSFPAETTVVYVFAVTRDIEKVARKVQTEANRLGRSLDCITYGSTFLAEQATGSQGGHTYYRFLPLQPR